MQIVHFIPETFERALKTFNYLVELNDAKVVKCLAYEAIVPDEISTVYEVYSNDAYNFYGILQLDHYVALDTAMQTFKDWSRASRIILLDRTDDSFLFELFEPLGIVGN